MTTLYKISSTTSTVLGSMVFVTAYTLFDPVSTGILYPTVNYAVSDAAAAQGNPYCEWTFTADNYDRIEALLTYIGLTAAIASKRISIYTPSLFGNSPVTTFTQYNATAHYPFLGTGRQKRMGGYTPTTIRFTNLVAY